MKSAGFASRLDDWLNPIMVKELRQAVKNRAVLAALLLFLLIQLGILLLNLFLEPQPANFVNLYAGRQIFEVLQGILLGTCMLLVPTYAGIRLASEHSDNNVDLLFISTLRPRAIIAGKLQAAVVLILLIFSACAPFMTFTYLLRGIDIPSILLVLAVDFLAVLLGTQLTIFLGAAPASWGLKLLLGAVGLGCLGMLFGSSLGGTLGILEEGLGSRMDSVEFWLIAGAIVTAVVAVMGLLFVWSVAVVSSPSSNRALPVRLYVLMGWLATGGVAALLAWRFREPIPLYLWMDAVVVLLCSQILTSINERERWGPRVARTIPRRWWLRGPAFLLYSGAAGGVLFAVVLLALTIALPSLALWHWRELFPPRFDIEFFGRRNTLVMVLLTLYTFDYCMTAVYLRRVVFPRYLKPLFTWVLALVLWGLGFALPYLLLFLFNNEELRFGQVNPWWYITNPFMTIYHYVAEWNNPSRAGFFLGGLWFLGGWAALTALLCLPWMLRQVRRFHPPERVS
jgi:hypothetical protein